MDMTKKMGLMALVVMLVLALPLTAGAKSQTYTGKCGDNLTFVFTEEDGVLTITGTGAIDDSAFNMRYGWMTSVIIQNGVTSIGNSAFYGCHNLTSISIPDSVTSIGDSAFYGCDNLTSITIPDSVTSIGKEAFVNCTSLASIHIPNGVTSIPDHIFMYCSSLTGVTIPDSVTSIGEYAFYHCSGLTGITIPDSVTSIGGCAFNYCTGLTSISIPSSVKSIGDLAFTGCRSLTSFTIPEGIASIPDNSFVNCSSLTSITIPVSVTSIGQGAFYHCASLTDVYYGGTAQQWAALPIGTYNEDLTGAAIHCQSSVHEHTPEILPAVAATCTEPGLTEGSKCAACGEVLVAQETVPALDHDWGEWVITKQPTASEEGEEIRVCKRDASHTETCLIPPVEEEDHFVPGDLNGNGGVDGRDLLRLAKYLAGESVEIDKRAADVNGDGNVDGRDLLRLAKYLAGLNVQLVKAN